MENEIRHNRTSEAKKKKDSAGKKKDYITRLIIVQLIVCTVLFSVAFMTKKFNDRMYNEIKAKFSLVMADSFTKDDAIGAFKSVSDFIFMPADEWAKNSATENESEAESASETVAETEAEIQELGVGGADLEVKSAVANASFAQYCVSAKITTPVHGKISSTFGYRIHPIKKVESFHGGIDIAAKEGTCISAAYYGKVTAVDYTEEAGNYIVMEHDGGIKTLYMHCSEINVEEGAYIRAGETIGYVGSTGASTGPHLHFEIRMGNIRYNPEYVLNIDGDEI